MFQQCGDFQNKQQAGRAPYPYREEDGHIDTMPSKRSKKKRKRSSDADASKQTSHAIDVKRQAETKPPTSTSSLMASIFGSSAASVQPPSTSTDDPTKAAHNRAASLFDDSTFAAAPKRVASASNSNERSASCSPTADENIKPQMDRKKILQLREEQATHMESSLDFPLAFGQDDDEDEDDPSSNTKRHSNPFDKIVLPKDEQIREMAFAIQQHGVCVLRQVIDRAVLNNIVTPKVDALERRLYGALDRRSIPWRCMPTPGSTASCKDTELFRFKEAASRCKGRMDVIVLDDDEFHHVDIMRNPKIYPIVSTLFGGSAKPNTDGDDAVKLVYAGIILNQPGSEDQPWHQDGHPLFPELAQSRNGDGAADFHGQLPCYALNVFIPLETKDGKAQSGPTEFLPGSQKSTTQSMDDTKTGKVAGPILKQGDALLYDYRVCHRGTANLSNRTRRILYLMYARPWFTDHVNFAYDKDAKRLFDEDVEDD